MAKLNTADRRALNPADFAIPEKAPGSGSYPIPDANHARDALARASGKPEEGRVKAAVRKRFPGITIGGEAKGEGVADKARKSMMMKAQASRMLARK